MNWLSLSLPSIDFTIQQARCSGEKAALELLQIIGGEQPYTLYLDGKQVSGKSFKDLDPGLHNIRVEDMWFKA